MRYLWDLYPAYRNEWTRSRWKRSLMTPLANYLRLWDYASAARVDEFIANSENVQRRIWKTYRRESRVVRPPVAVETFYWKPPEDYYLIVSGLVPYKRVDAAVRAFNQSGRRLRVVGDGPEYPALRRIAAANIEFCGHVSDAGSAGALCPLPGVSHAGRRGLRHQRGGSSRQWQAGDRAGQRRCARNRA